jgi:hypothetical protein
MATFELSKESGIDGNCPTWKGASAVYSKAYCFMEDHGPDYNLIDALDCGDEEILKANMLRINLDGLIQREE